MLLFWKLVVLTQKECVTLSPYAVLYKFVHASQLKECVTLSPLRILCNALQVCWISALQVSWLFLERWCYPHHSHKPSMATKGSWLLTSSSSPKHTLNLTQVSTTVELPNVNSRPSHIRTPWDQNSMGPALVRICGSSDTVDPHMSELHGTAALVRICEKFRYVKLFQQKNFGDSKHTRISLTLGLG